MKDQTPRQKGVRPKLVKSYFAKVDFLEIRILCLFPRHPKLYWPRHSKNLVGVPEDQSLFQSSAILTSLYYEPND